MISSPGNPQLKLVRRLQHDRRFREREKLFVTEGTRWLREWSVHPDPVQRVFYTGDWLNVPGNAELLAALDVPGFLVSDDVMAAMSATETPPGVLVLAAMLFLPPPQDSRLVLLLDAVSDPGNLGTMLRTAAAAGVDAALLAPGCVDAYNPKVVRGGMGAHLRLPILQLDWPQIAEVVGPTTVWLADAGGDTQYTEVDWTQPATLVIGNEAHGPGADAQALSSRSIVIPMAAATESLNAATAAAVILFEAARQRGFNRAGATP